MKFEYKIRSEVVQDIPPKQFSEDGNFHYYVRIFLEAPAAALDHVLSVKYTLHPTFRNRFRISENGATNFDVKIWTYGYFDTQANIILKNGSTLEVRGYVQWPYLRAVHWMTIHRSSLG